MTLLAARDDCPAAVLSSLGGAAGMADSVGKHDDEHEVLS
jgi:hypothetical protein